MSNEQLFASFLLDRETEIEIAMPAERVEEAVTVNLPFRHVPNSAEFFEGIMKLRQDVIPVINLKKRLGLDSVCHDHDAKVAVVRSGKRRYGILFDDIKDVLSVPVEAVEPIDSILLSRDSIILKIIKLDSGERTLQLLDLEKLFPQQPVIARPSDGKTAEAKKEEQEGDKELRYTIFSSGKQEYGIAVEDTREICFLSDIDPTFQNGVVEGALRLRGHTIPVLNSYRLFGNSDPMQPNEDTRILVLKKGGVSFGLMVDKISEIVTIGQSQILPMPGSQLHCLQGICQYSDMRNILLLEVEKMAECHMDTVKSMSRVNSGDSSSRVLESTHHLITENCYLIFSIGKNYAIQLKDVQEIIETDELLSLPDRSEIVQDVINLRGVIVPVLDLSFFYGIRPKKDRVGKTRLIIGQYGNRNVGFIVDDIVTIYKQEKFYDTPALKPELQSKKDTVDRMIEYIGDSGLKEHVLVINVKNIVRNHLKMDVEYEVDDHNEGRGSDENMEHHVHIPRVNETDQRMSYV